MAAVDVGVEVGAVVANAGADLQTTIAHFLDCLYETGGPSAFAKIKAVIPTYECIRH